MAPGQDYILSYLPSFILVIPASHDKCLKYLLKHICWQFFLVIYAAKVLTSHICVFETFVYFFSV